MAISMDVSVAREYVRQQLESMGVRHITQEEIEAYTLEFLQLLEEKDQTFMSSSSNQETSSNASTPAVSKIRVSRENSTMSTLSTPLVDHTHKLVEVSINHSGGHPMKRKVLRKTIGEVPINTSILSDDTTGSCRSLVDDENVPSQKCHDKSHPVKSFIRPPSSHPHTRGLKKNDPVQRYHEFREMWENQKAPGEKTRSHLRWHIREQLLLQDTPFYVPSHRVRRPSDYVIPTEKKRQSLRWEIRHQLAHHVQ